MIRFQFVRRDRDRPFPQLKSARKVRLNFGVIVVCGALVRPSTGLAASISIEQQHKLAELTKLQLEARKLQIDIAQSQASLFTWDGLSTYLARNAATLLAIIAGLWALYRYLSEQTKQREEKEERRFSDIAEHLGSESEQSRMGAAVLLPSFLRQGFEGFYIQVFNLVAGSLRLLRHESSDHGGFRQALVTVYRESFPKARALIPAGPSDKDNPEIAFRLNSSEVGLQGAYLVNADLKGAWLRQANFNDAIARDARLQGANLEFASMKRCSLEVADLTSANLHGADLSEADLRRAVLSNCLLENASLQKANLTGAEMIGVTARGANFLGATLDDADLQGADFAPMELGGKPANLDLAASLVGTKLYGARGLSEQQRNICREKGALLAPEEKPDYFELHADEMPRDSHRGMIEGKGLAL